MSLQFIGIHYSPWSIRARWALDHHGHDYDYSEYLIMLGAPWLRLKTRRFVDKVTVPVLITPEARILDSFEIAKWADERGRAETLFPTEHADDIVRWNGVGERLAAAGRDLSTRDILRDPAALMENTPAELRALPGSRAATALGARYILSKYDQDGDGDILSGRMHDALVTLREALDGGDYLCGEFSYADVIMATSLQFVRPPDAEYVQLGPSSRVCWTRDELAAEFSWLVAWRDRIYERHYPR